MVESIAPVVYGGKTRYRWAVVLHAGTAAVAGALFGMLLSGLGMLALAPWGTTGDVVIAVSAVAYSARELLGLPLPLFDRRQQVPDWWRTFYGPHVAASLYGAGLGIGFLTFLRYGTYVVVCVLAVASGDLLVGALLGATFGLSRGLTTLMSAATSDEVEAASVVERLERVAAGNRPRLANGLVLIAIAVVALATACQTPPSAGRAAPGDGTAVSGYSEPVTLGRIRNPRITESSGLVASRTYEGVLWTHNDSGDGPFLYALDMKGRTLGRWEVTGAEAFDWEDIALGPGDILYIGDIGDNTASRPSITIYRVPEPDPRAGNGNTEPATPIELTYPRGPQDAETLMVHPVTGDLYIVTKNISGQAVLFSSEAPLDKTIRLKRLGPLTIPSTYGGITAGDIAIPGDKAVLATYLEAFEFVIGNGRSDFDSIWDTEPAPIDVGARPQGEAIAYGPDGTSILTTSEGARSALTLVESL